MTRAGKPVVHVVRRPQPRANENDKFPVLPNGWVIHPPVNLGPPVNSEFNESGPAISADGLTFLFQSNRPGGQGDKDIWICTRTSLEDPFGEPVNLGPLVNSEWSDGSPYLSPDGLTLLFSSSRPDGHDDGLWMCSRPSLSEPFGEPIDLGPDVNDGFTASMPTLSANGLTLLFAGRLEGSQQPHDLLECTRATKSESFGRPVNLGSVVNSPSGDYHPNLSVDGLTLLFYSNRPGGQGGKDIWICTRTSLEDPFGEPVNLGPGVNSGSHDRGPYLSPDGRILLFSSNRPDGQGGEDLWMAQIERRGSQR
jgi:Tol biopolymer transport system component